MRRLVGVVATLCVVSTAAHSQSPAASARAGVEAFNRALDGATRSMSNAAILALWEDDGVSLLPSTKPIVGKPAIAAFLHDVMASLKNATMERFELQCFDIDVSGDWASEWCTEHQVVRLADDKPPFDGRGKMLLVLHKGADGAWRLKREMWNQAQPE